MRARLSLLRLSACLLAAVGLGAGCSQERWEGYAEPDRTRPEVYQYIGTYGSLQECREMALAVLRFQHAEEKGDYECGKNCRWEAAGAQVVKRCEATGR